MRVISVLVHEANRVAHGKEHVREKDQTSSLRTWGTASLLSADLYVDDCVKVVRKAAITRDVSLSRARIAEKKV